jgi:uncharacterized protein (TIGR00730 family)
MNKVKKKFVNRRLKKNRFRVSIFGSARIKKGTREYKKVYNFAKLLGSEGIDIVTGGGPGLMEAANSGHQAGRKNSETSSIGLNIKLPTEQRPNKSLDIVYHFDRFSKRLDKFMLLSNAVVIAPGGVGTLLEFFYTWQLVQTKKIHNIPIILMGREYPKLIKWIKENPLKKGYVGKDDMDLLFIAKKSTHAAKRIKKAFQEYQDKK